MMQTRFWIAQRASAAVLALCVAVHLGTIVYEITWWKRLRSDFTYIYRRGKVELNGWMFRAGLLRP